MTPQTSVLDLNAVLSGLADTLQRVAGPRLPVLLDLADSACEVRADRERLDRLILHLLLMVRDAVADPDRVTLGTAAVVLDEIYTRDHPTVPPGSCVELRVVAEPAGGGEGAVEAASADRSDHAGGGRFRELTTVSTLVHELGGHLWLGHRRDGGPLAKVFLPRISRPMAGADATILLVEDEADVRELIRSMLTSVGYHVIEAATGGEALRRCQDPAQPIALAMTDVVMPGISGPELAESMIAVRPGLKVLMMSGYLDQGHALRGAAAGDVAFLGKPFVSDDLLRAVRSAIGDPAV